MAMIVNMSIINTSDVNVIHGCNLNRVKDTIYVAVRTADSFLKHVDDNTDDDRDNNNDSYGQNNDNKSFWPLD